MKGTIFPLRCRRFFRLLLGLAIVIGWLGIHSHQLSLAGPSIQENGQTYTVQPGDSLARISVRFYGDATRWTDIFAATNSKAQEDESFAFIDNPRLIFPGQKLWIPDLPTAAQPATPTPQPVDPTQTPTVASTNTPSSATAREVASTPSDELVTTLRQLLGESGALVSAQEQSTLAREHLGFLQTELDAENLAATRRHAEHIVNILEGERGVLFGDNDRDGQTQNPGDGVGVGGHLGEAQAQIEAVLGTLDEMTTAGATDPALQQLVAATVESQGLVQPAAEKAFQIFAADSVSETQAIAAELASALNELQTSIDSSVTRATQLLALVDASPAAGEASLLPLRALLAEEGGALVSAQEQSALAREHLGFLQTELDAENLAAARRHAEHIVNILEGERGLLFGDNDRDGQTQNPGDGVGVGSYLVIVQTDLDALAEATLGRENASAIRQLRDATAESQPLVKSAAEKAFQIFAADSVDETSALAVELSALLRETAESISDIVATGSQLLATPTSSAGADLTALLPLRALFAEEGGALVSAQEQSTLAREHLGFLQTELDAENLAAARRHAEHIVNILEGERGLLFGDNDRDGQTQNPGDGVGVGGHLGEAQAQIEAVLGTLDEMTTAGATDPALQQLVAATVESQGLVQPAAEKAFQIFAADSVPETEAIVAELVLLLNQLEEGVATAFTAGGQLFSP